LHALFTDSFEGNSVLLCDTDATTARIRAELDELCKVSKDDVVVITFSGHGTDTHELVTYDTDPDRAPATAISLEELTELFSTIPARRLICVLDCCFSGGAGAKVLHTPVQSRSLSSADLLIDRLSGDGRLILTASRADEEALEHVALGHGMLTHFLLEALQGAEEVRVAGTVSVYRLLDYVSRRVTDAADQYAHPQHPTLRGAIDQELLWPILVPGKLYKEAFPERTTSPATAEIDSLSSFGFSKAILDAWKGAIPSLNQLQVDAINEFGVLEGQDIVVSAPTSSGKTLIGELAALRAVQERRRAMILLPLKALVSDKFEQFQRIYRPFGIRTIQATGELSGDMPALMRGQYDICLMTYEKFAAVAIGAPHVLEQLGLVVIDEVQMIADQSRGANLEFVLTMLRLRRGSCETPQIIALSAVIGDTNGLERWLNARLLRRDTRPVPLDEGLILADGSYRHIDPEGKEQLVPSLVERKYGKGSSQDWVIPLVKELVTDGKQVIVFRETKGLARGTGIYLANSLGLNPASRALSRLPTGDPSRASSELRQALRGGVAFHNADLESAERRVIEEEFRRPDSEIRVIAATTTLAMGVNTPAEAVVIVGLEHPGNQPYSVAEYKNMVGRAGRLGLADRGSSYLLALTPHHETLYWDRYVRARPEDLHSRFLADDTDPRSLMIRVLAAQPRQSSHGMTADEVVAFLEASFGAFQQRQLNEHWTWSREALLDALGGLERHGLVEQDAQGGYRLTELGLVAGRFSSW
jgi:replicative superfamily II helicase